MTNRFQGQQRASRSRSAGGKLRTRLTEFGSQGLQFVALMIAFALLVAAKGFVVAHPALTAALVLAFSFLHLAASVVTKRPNYLYATILLALTSYFMAFHALGVPGSVFPLLSVPPLVCLWAVGRHLTGRLPPELAGFARTVFRAMHLTTAVFAVWALAQAPKLIAAPGFTRYVAGFTFLCYAVLYLRHCLSGGRAAHLYSFSAFLTAGAIACGAALGRLSFSWAPALAAAWMILFVGTKLHRVKTYRWSRHLYFCGAAVLCVSLVLSTWRFAWFLLELPLASLVLWVSYLWLAGSVGAVQHATSAERGVAKWLFLPSLGLSAAVVPLALFRPVNLSVAGAALLCALTLSWIAIRRHEETSYGVNVYVLAAVMFLSAGLFGLAGQLSETYAILWSLLGPVAVMTALGLLHKLSSDQDDTLTCGSLSQSAIFAAFFAWYAPLSLGQPVLAAACAGVAIVMSLTLAWGRRDAFFLRAIGPAAAGALVSGAMAWAGFSMTAWALCAGAAAVAGLCVALRDAKRIDLPQAPLVLAWLIFSASAVVIASSLNLAQTLYSATAVGFVAILVAGWQKRQGKRDLSHLSAVILSVLATAAAVALGPGSGLSPTGAGLCVLVLSAAYAVAWGLGRGAGYARAAHGLFALALLLVIFGESSTVGVRLALGAMVVLALFFVGAAARIRFPAVASSAVVVGHATSAVLACGALIQAWQLGSSALPLAVVPFVLLYGLMPGLRKNYGLRLGTVCWVSLLALFSIQAYAGAPYREHIFPLALLALTLVALGHALRRPATAGWSRPLYVCGATLAVFCGGVSLFALNTGGSWHVFLANGFVFALLFLILQEDIFAYLLTLSLSLMAYDWVQASTSLFTQDVLFYLIIGMGALGVFLLLPHLKAAVGRLGALPMPGIYTWRGAALAAVPALGLGLFVLSAYSVKITEHPRFCLSCHYMTEYYQSWQHSSHKNVTCVKCHYDPGVAAELKGKMAGLVQLVKYVSHSHSIKPHALISDASCLRPGCHRTMADNDKTLIFKGKLRFRHSTHLGQNPRGIVLHCANCHEMVLEGVHIAVTETTCVTCHFYGRGKAPLAVGKCRTCHLLPEGSVNFAGQPFNHREFLAGKPGVECVHCHSNVTQGQGSVATTRCRSCHLETFKEIGDKTQFHLIHTSEGHLDCLQCHDLITHGIHPMAEQLLTSKNCTTCHGGDQHTIQERIYDGTAAPEVESTPDVMYKAGVACDGCHTDVKFVKAGEMVLSTKVSSGKQCGNCHASEAYAQMAAVWQEDVKDRLTEMQAAAEELAGLCSSADAPEEQIKPVKELLATARSRLEIIRLDGSYGAHNMAYVSAILDSVEDALKEGRSAIAELKKPDQGVPEE